MLARLARSCVRHKWIAIGAWIALLVVVNAVAGAVGPDYRTDFTLPSSETKDVQELLEANNPERAGFSSQIVVQAEQGVDDPEVQAALQTLMDFAAEQEGVSVTSPFDSPQQVSQDGTIAFAQLDVEDRSFEEVTELGNDIEEFGAEQPAVEGMTVEYGGDLFGEFELPESEILGIIAAVIILILAFGSVLAMGLPIGTALFGLGVASALVALASNVISMPDFTTAMVAMIGLGVGIDYALFIVTRYREGLKLGLVGGGLRLRGDGHQRARRPVRRPHRDHLPDGPHAGRAQLRHRRGHRLGHRRGDDDPRRDDAGAGAAGPRRHAHRQHVARRPHRGRHRRGRRDRRLRHRARPRCTWPGSAWRSSSSPCSFAVPSLRKLIPHRAERAAEQRFWYRWSRFVQHRPWPSMLGAAAFLLILLAIPLFSIRLGFGDLGNAPEDKTVRRAYDLLAEGFGPGTNGPLFITVEGDAANDPAPVGAVRPDDRRHRRRALPPSPPARRWPTGCRS